MTKVSRYDKHQLVGTNLNPLEDVLFWIRGLRSRGLVEDMLREKHGIRGINNINKRTVAINKHAETSVSLLEQGFNGPIETSFLPLYYGLLNLSKIYVICSRHFSELYLARNRHHGAISKPQLRGSYILKDKILVIQRGTIPLLYKTITGFSLDKDNTVTLEEMFPFIPSVSVEYRLTNETDTPLQHCDLKIVKNANNESYIELNLKEPLVRNSEHNGRNQFLKDFTKVNVRKYRTESIVGDSRTVDKELKKKIKRFLLYEQGIPEINQIEIFLPISGKRILLPEELPIILIFFHFSNIVRYYPELLSKMKNSPEWGMIQALSRHGAFRFLNLFWSYVQQESFSIHSI